MWLDALGWTATGIFSTSYFFKQPAVLRKIQAGAALLWMVYGLAIHSAPVVVANLIVGVAAIYTSFRAVLGKNGAGAETADGNDVKGDSGSRKSSGLFEAIARLSHVPENDKDMPGMYMLPICTMVWCGALPVARTSYLQEPIGITASGSAVEAEG